MLKRCNRCQQEKNSSEFRKDATKYDGLSSYCKLCRRQYDASNYIQKYGEQTRARNDERAAIMRARLLEYRMMHPCLVCGENEPSCLDFHHEDPSVKEFTIGTRLTGSWETMLAELAKCIVLCANCHRKFHAGRISLIEQRWDGRVA